LVAYRKLVKLPYRSDAVKRAIWEPQILAEKHGSDVRYASACR
jgi:hypothetical protein